MGERAGDGDAPALAARNWCGIAVGRIRRARPTNAISRAGTLHGVDLRQAEVDRPFRDRGTHRAPRIERAVGVLEHDLHMAAMRAQTASPTECATSTSPMRMAPEVGSISRATQRATVVLPEPELADDADRLAAPHRDVDVLGRPARCGPRPRTGPWRRRSWTAFSMASAVAPTLATRAGGFQTAAPRRSASAYIRTAATAGSGHRCPTKRTAGPTT